MSIDQAAEAARQKRSTLPVPGLRQCHPKTHMYKVEMKKYSKLIKLSKWKTYQLIQFSNIFIKCVAYMNKRKTPKMNGFDVHL